MNKSIKEEVVGIFKHNLSNTEIDLSNLDDDILQLVVDSIIFIQIIADVEECFNFKFDDEKLLFSELPSINSLIEYIESKIRR